MVDRRFPILGTEVPTMLGREALMGQLLRGLTKPTPDHLQIVGPRYAGKTVILNELARRLQATEGPYTAILLWDLGHRTPTTDDLFMERFTEQLVKALAAEHSDFAEHLKTAKEHPYQDVAEVLTILTEEGGKILAILDGFDKPLSSGRLTRNLWDQLRELALEPSLRLVTASRRTLRELIRQPDAQTSDFWNIFEPSPVRVGCFDDDDLAAILSQVDTLDFTTGAKTELWNATNGAPVLLLELLNRLHEDHGQGQVSPAAVLEASTSVLSRLKGHLEMLWDDCLPAAQDLWHRVNEEQSVHRSGIAHEDIEPLVEQGFVQASGNKLQRPCRLLKHVLEGKSNEGNALVRLFANEDAYHQHFKGVMQRRIDQLMHVDPTLKRYLQRGAEDLPDHPDVFLSNVRGIVNQGFDLIWQAEFDGKKIPAGWMSIWKYKQERGVENWQATFPQGVHRVRLLNLMTGTDRSAPVAKYVTKSTYTLMNAAHAFGDFGQHLEGASIDRGTAYAAFHLCIELASSLARELPR